MLRAMRGAARRGQKGMTLMSFITVLAVGGFFLYLGIKLFPMYSEFYGVKSALRGLAAETDISTTDPARIRDLFMRRMDMNYSSNVKREHVKIDRTDDGLLMTVEYEVRVPLVANLDAVGRFHADQKLTRTSGRN